MSGGGTHKRKFKDTVGDTVGDTVEDTVEDTLILDPKNIIEYIKRYSPHSSPDIKTLLHIITLLNKTHDPKYTDDLIAHIKTVIGKYNTLNECKIDDIEDIEDIGDEEDRKCDRQLSDKIAEKHAYLDLILDILKAGFVSQMEPSPIQINISKSIRLIERHLSGHQEHVVSRRDMTLKGCTPGTYLVNGPVSFYAFVSPDSPDQKKKYIYLFGDVHSKKSGCEGDRSDPPFIRLEDLIRNTIRIHSNKIIDVFLETAISRSTFNDNFMSELVQSFILDECTLPYTFYPNTCKQKYPNARFHSANIRWSYVPRPKLYKMLKSPSPDMKIIDLITKKLGKQIFAIKDKAIQLKLYEILETIHKKPKSDKSSFHKEPIYTEDKLSPLMDVYLLGRLFRSYDTKKGIKDKKVDFGNEDVNYAIVYTGYAHTFFYRKFLHELGYKEVYEVKQIDLKTRTYSQCIEIPLLLDDETGDPFLDFGYVCPDKPSKMRVKKRSSSHRKQSFRRSKISITRRVKSIPKKGRSPKERFRPRSANLTPAKQARATDLVCSLKDRIKYRREGAGPLNSPLKKGRATKARPPAKQTH